jgi:hypothetical protein
MGIFKRVLRMNQEPRHGVRGTAQIVSCTGYNGRGIKQNCFAEVVVEAEGLEPTAVSWHGVVHRKQWPFPGMTLPVLVDVDDPRRLSFVWDEIERSDDRAKGNAEALAEAMRARRR